MNVFFDVDYTILGFDGSLRPGTHDAFAALHADGHALYVWSGRGVRRDVVEDHGLDPYVTDVLTKPTEGYLDAIAALTVPPDFVVDDHAAIVRRLGGYLIPPYYYAASSARDREMTALVEVIAAHANGRPVDHPRYRRRPRD